MIKEKSVYILFKNIIKEFLESQGIDINNPGYESSEQWKRIKDIAILKMRLEEFVKMHLIVDETGFESMQYKYEMGNNSEMTEDECEDRILAEHIIFEFVERNKEEDDEIENEIEMVCNYFRRLQERLKEYLNFDLKRFDKKSKRNRIEKSKILFFFYMLEKEYFPNKEILTVLNKLSMENIELNKVKSFGGMVVKFIKKSLEREMSIEEIYKINGEVNSIVYEWDQILENAYILIDFLEGKGYEYDFQKTIECLRYEVEDKKEKSIYNYLGSPIEVLYLKIIQHEYLSNIMDIREINSIPFNYSHNLSQEIIHEMKELHNSYVDLDDIEEYIEKNAKKIAKYVYLGMDINKDDVKRIKNFKKKIRRWIRFCFRAKPWLNGEDIANELQIISALQAIIELAVEDNYVRYNVSDNLLKELKQAHNFGDSHKRALTVPEQELFMNFLSSEKTQYHHWYPIFRVMLGTGMRVGEICGLRWEDIDLENGMIDVNHTLVYYNHAVNGCYFNINTPKTRAGKRQIPMLEDVKEAILMEKAYQEYNGIKCNMSVDGYTNFIFVNRFGNLQHQGTLNKALRRIIRECNDMQLAKGKKNPVLLPNFSCHSLRHTFTTRLVEAGVNIKVIQELCGHTRSDVTLDIYTTVTKELKQREFGNFEEKLNQQKQEWRQTPNEDVEEG